MAQCYGARFAAPRPFPPRLLRPTPHACAFVPPLKDPLLSRPEASPALVTCHPPSSPSRRPHPLRTPPPPRKACFWPRGSASPHRRPGGARLPLEPFCTEGPRCLCRRSVPRRGPARLTVSPLPSVVALFRLLPFRAEQVPHRQTSPDSSSPPATLLLSLRFPSLSSLRLVSSLPLSSSPSSHPNAPPPFQVSSYQTLSVSVASGPRQKPPQQHRPSSCGQSQLPRAFGLPIRPAEPPCGRSRLQPTSSLPTAPSPQPWHAQHCVWPRGGPPSPTGAQPPSAAAPSH